MNKEDHKNTSHKHSLSVIRSMRGKKGGFNYELAVIVLVILLAMGYYYHRLAKSLEFSPEKLYETTFVEPITSIKDLKGSSKSMVGFDSWIRFNCPSGITLRKANEFKPYIPEVGRSWFVEKYPGDPILNQSVSNYEYLVRSENNIGNIVNEAVLINKNTHDYFYRTWGL